MHRQQSHPCRQTTAQKPDTGIAIANSKTIQLDRHRAIRITQYEKDTENRAEKQSLETIDSLYTLFSFPLHTETNVPLPTLVRKKHTYSGTILATALQKSHL
jgi:hypothetical protein